MHYVHFNRGRRKKRCLIADSRISDRVRGGKGVTGQGQHSDQRGTRFEGCNLSGCAKSYRRGGDACSLKADGASGVSGTPGTFQGPPRPFQGMSRLDRGKGMCLNSPGSTHMQCHIQLGII